MIPVGALGLHSNRRQAMNPFTDWTWKYAHVIPQQDAAVSGLPFPVQSTVPGLHETGEVLKLPLRKSVSAFGRDDYGLYDYGDSAAKASRVPHVLTAVGSPTVDTTGVTFDASPEYYSIPGSADSLLGGTSYYVRADVRFDNVTLVQTILDSMTGANDAAWHLRFHGGIKRLDWATAAGAGDHYASWNPSLDTWYRIEVIKTYIASPLSETVSIYVDGVSIYGPVTDSQTWGVSGKAIYIGREVGRNNDSQLYGSIRNVLILKGFAITPTSSFVLPQDLFQHNPHEVLNLPLTGHTTDLSYGTAKAAPETAHAVTLVGSANITNGYLTGGHATLPDSDDWAFGILDWTVEFYIKFNSLGVYVLLDHGYDTSSTRSWLLYLNTNILSLSASQDGTTDNNYTKPWTPTTGVWYHVAVCRVGSVTRFFIDGAQLGTDMGANDIHNTAKPLGILATTAGTYISDAGMQDLRITKGVALYTANFTPPARGSLPVAMQDWRLAKGATELACTYPERGRNPITGVVDAWTLTDLSDTADNELTAYIGNAAAEAPTEGVTWPTEWKRNFFRSGFGKDLIGGSLLTAVNGAIIASDGGVCVAASSQYFTTPDSADLPTGTADWAIVLHLTLTGDLSPDAWHYFLGQLSGGDYWLVGYRGSGQGFFVQTSTGTLAYDASLLAPVSGTSFTIAFVRSGNDVLLYVNGQSEGKLVDGMMTSLPDVSTVLSLSHLGAYYTDALWHNMLVLNDDTLTLNQLAVLDAALRTPSTFNEIGALEANA